MMKGRLTVRAALLCGMAMCAVAPLAPACALAQVAQRMMPIDIPAGPVSAALMQLGRMTGQNILFTPDVVAGLQSRAVSGRFTPEQAARQMLRGTPLDVARDATGALIVRRQHVAMSDRVVAPQVVRQVRRPLADPAPRAVAAEPQPAEEGIEEIVVTAQKRRQNVNDVGMSITAISGDQLASAGFKGPEDLGKSVPAFNYSRTAYGQPIYTLRGVGFYDTVAAASPAVSVYLDEVPLPYPFMTRGVSLDVERVEVLKGPQGTLFGQNSTGGAINFIANRPTDQFKAGVDAGYASYDEVTVGGFISGPITGTLKGRIAASLDQGGAWQRSYTRPGDKMGATRLYNGRLLLDWEPVSDLTLRFNANGWIDKSDEQAGQPWALLTASRASQALKNAFAQYPTPSNARSADWDPGVPLGANDTIRPTTFDGFRRDNWFGQLSLRADYKFGDGLTLTSITAWEKLHQSGLIDGDGMSIANYHSTEIADIRSFSQELRIAGDAGRLQWMIGGNVADDHVDQYSGIFTGSGLSTFPFNTGATIATTRIKTYAAFANAEYALSDALSMTAGIRYTDVRIRNEGCTLDGRDGQFAGYVTGIAARHNVVISVPPGSCITLDPLTFQPTGLVKGRLDQNNVPFHLGLNWKAARGTLFYARLSKGYKAGSFTPVGAVYAPSLDPAVQESVLAYEAGFKLGLADRRLQLNGAAFYYDYTGKQVRGKIVDPAVGSLNKLINIPKSRITGGELQLTWAPDSHWLLNGGLSYTDSRIRGNYTNYSIAGVLKNMNGQMLPFTPKWQLNGGIDYNRPVSADVALVLGASAKYQSMSYSGLGEEPLFRNNAYANLDLRLGLRSVEEGRWSATLFVDNVTNTYSWNNVALNGSDIVTRMANRPRIVGIRFSVKN